MHIAVARNYSEIVKLLLQTGADPNAQDYKGNTPCHFAAEKNRLDMLKLLVENEGSESKDNVNAVNKYNWSVLHSAASAVINECEDWKMIEWLLEIGVNTDIISKAGNSVRDVFFEKDWSYAKQYDELLAKSKETNSNGDYYILQMSQRIDK